MRRIVAAAGFAGAGVLVARAVVRKVNPHERLAAACERMLEEMPDDFPPKQMMGSMGEIRANTARTLELLERREGSGVVPDRAVELFSASRGTARIERTKEVGK